MGDTIIKTNNKNFLHLSNMDKLEKLINQSTGYESQFSGYSNNEEIRTKMRNKHKNQRDFFNTLLVK